MNMCARWLIAIVAAPLFLTSSVFAKVTLPAIIGDHMVVQAEKKVNIWGWADPGETVRVTFAGQSKSAKAGQDGAWRVTLDPATAAEPLSMTIKGKNTIVVKDILVGEVWLCSGQSNMTFRLNSAKNGRQAAAKATNTRIRLFHVPMNTMPTKAGRGRWVVCNPKAAAGFSAVGYYFGRELQQKLDQPVGLIESGWGGTPAEAWTSAPAMEAQPSLKPLVIAAHEKQARYNPQAAQAKYEKALAAWKEKATKAKAQGQKAPRQPRKPVSPDRDPHTPAVLFNSMIEPLIPFSIRGAIWYQGERNANAGRAFAYRTLLPVMIRDWRGRWKQGDFPFGIVQLPNWRAVQTKPVEPNNWSVLRESQLLTAQKLPNVGLATIIDLGEAKTIHPTDKVDVGHRLLLWALAKVYDKDVVYSGPIYSGKSIEGDKVRLTFKHVDGGLVAKGHDGKLVGFAVAGADKVFHSATATIDGDAVVVHSDAVAKPVSVRYAWAMNPVCNLYNKAGLPASPFRTDDWHVATQPK